MKQRVAIIATLITFALCIVFLGVVMDGTRNALNRTASDEISTICRLSAIEVESAADGDTPDPLERLRGIATQSGFVFALYSPTGETFYTNRPHISDSLTQSERTSCQKDEVFSFTRENSTAGWNWLYAATVLPSGEYLSVSYAAYTRYTAVGGYLIWLVALALVLSGLVYALMYVSAKRTQRMVGNVLHVVEDFSEGRFESRLTGIQGDSIEQAARFNEALGRLQDRVFKQKTRNDALGTVLNHMQNGILAVDEALNVILITPAAKSMLGITGSPEGVPIQDASKVVKLDHVLREAMFQQGVYTNEVAARTSVGRGHRPLRLYVSPMLKDGKAVGAVALVEDITELRRLEQVRTDFAANVSHELKTPLTSIKGFVETLQNGAIENPEMAQKFLRIIMLEADRLTRLINDILTVSKLESGTDAPPTERIRLDEMTRDVTDMLSMQAGEKDVTLTCNIGGPCAVLGNPDRVEQMLINLVENAIKYNKPGGSVAVSLFSAEDTCNLSISDTGIGIPEEHLPRLFERFYRVDKGRSRSMGGTGLGLSIVKHIVKSMDGMIEVHSKLGEGTEFLITLPCVSASEESVVEEAMDRS